jgi:hypothetical protein
MAYDSLKRRHSARRASKEYLKILHLAAGEGETLVDDALRLLMDRGERITADAVETQVRSNEPVAPATEVTIDEVALDAYDELLSAREVIR